MATLTADGNLQSALSQIKERTVIQGADGRLLGLFTPAGQHLTPLTLEAAALFDPDELERRKQSKERGYTIDEVMEHLRSLETRS